MYGAYRVVLCVPAGRRRYMEVLLPQLRRLRGVADACVLWLNTRDVEDAQWIRAAAAADPDWLSVQELPDGARVNRTPWKSVCRFYPTACDPDTVYVKVDDDIVAVDAPDRFEAFVRYRVEHPRPFLVSANVLNNPRITHLHQRDGRLSTERGSVGDAVEDPVGLLSGEFAAWLHGQVLRGGRVDCARWRFPGAVELEGRLSINWVAWMGADFAEFGGAVPQHDETWLTVERPAELGRPLAVYGGFVVAHLAFEAQRPAVEAAGLLEEYAAAAGGGQFC